MTKDPMLLATPDNAKELFIRLSQAANGFSTDDVIGASVNMLINGIRQGQPTRAKAEAAIDEIFGKTKAILLAHYDQLGRKRGIFPFDQEINGKLFKNKQTFGGG